MCGRGWLGVIGHFLWVGEGIFWVGGLGRVGGSIFCVGGGE